MRHAPYQGPGVSSLDSLRLGFLLGWIRGLVGDHLFISISARHNFMGSTSSRAAAPAAEQDGTLTRQLSVTAHEVITQNLRNDLRKARAEKAKYERHAEEAWAETQQALGLLERQQEEFKFHGLMACAGTAAITAAVVGLVMTRSHSRSISRVLQEASDLKRRSEADLVKRERFGCERLAKSLVPALDAMDALVASGGGDAEGSRLTHASFQSALRSHGIEKIEPSIGAPRALPMPHLPPPPPTPPTTTTPTPTPTPLPPSLSSYALPSPCGRQAIASRSIAWRRCSPCPWRARAGSCSSC